VGFLVFGTFGLTGFFAFFFLFLYGPRFRPGFGGSPPFNSSDIVLLVRRVPPALATIIVAKGDASPVLSGETMLVMDTPRPATFRGKRILTAHLLSTLPGGAGTAELLAFAKKLGMKAEWIQHRGGYNEHFDLMGTRCQAAKEAGALVDRAVVARTIREKRGQL